MEVTRKGNKLANLPKYPFHRAVHYFYDLDNFKRVKGHPSYVRTFNNSPIFGLTYKQEDKRFKGTPLAKIVNRKYFGLPQRC